MPGEQDKAKADEVAALMAQLEAKDAELKASEEAKVKAEEEAAAKLAEAEAAKAKAEEEAKAAVQASEEAKVTIETLTKDLEKAKASKPVIPPVEPLPAPPSLAELNKAARLADQARSDRQAIVAEAAKKAADKALAKLD